MAYEDSDYTFMIAIMHCPNRTILVLKLTLVVEIWALLSRRGRHCSSALSDFRWHCSTVLRKGTRSFCRSLTLTCQNSPCWRSCERCITSFLSSRSPWAAIADSAQSIDASAHGPHVACALIGMCCNTYALSSSSNRLQRGYQECGCPSLHSWYRKNCAA